MKRMIALGLGILLVMSACEKDDETSKVLQNATKVELSITNKEIKVDDKPFTLKVSTTPVNLEKNGVWSSSNSSVASVDENGLVTPLGKGSANITCSFSEKIFATCDVKVIENIVEATGVSLTLNKISVVNGETYQLEANIDSDKVTEKTLIWESYNEDVAMVDDDGEITAVGLGTAVIVVETSNRYRAKCRVTVVKPGFVLDTKMIGTWTGIRMELISQSDGKIYDEAAIGGLLKAGSDIEAFCEDVRTSYSYDLLADGSLKMFMSLKGGTKGYLKGVISDGGSENTFTADFVVDRIQVVGEAEDEEMSGVESLAKQTIVYKNKLVEIQVPFGSGYDLKVYYKVTK
ncbi:MAG: Ig-like domain-containing protein [Marinifilaceae bacterium]